MTLLFYWPSRGDTLVVLVINQVVEKMAYDYACHYDLAFLLVF